VAEPSLLDCFVQPLNTSQIRYFVTEGVATIIYGEPSWTKAEVEWSALRTRVCLEGAQIAAVTISFPGRSDTEVIAA
jgi:hypothetical protein